MLRKTLLLWVILCALTVTFGCEGTNAEEETASSNGSPNNIELRYAQAVSEPTTERIRFVHAGPGGQGLVLDLPALQ